MRICMGREEEIEYIPIEKTNPCCCPLAWLRQNPLKVHNNQKLWFYDGTARRVSTWMRMLQQLRIQLKAATNGVYCPSWQWESRVEDKEGSGGGLYQWHCQPSKCRLALAIKKFCQVKLPKIANCLDYALFKDTNESKRRVERKRERRQL